MKAPPNRNLLPHSYLSNCRANLRLDATRYKLRCSFFLEGYALSAKRQDLYIVEDRFFHFRNQPYFADNLSFNSLVKYPLRRNQSSIESCSCPRGTFVPISISPSATGSVSSKALALVKLRMEKLSSHFSGQGSIWPPSSYSTRILRANIARFNHTNFNHTNKDRGHIA